MSPDSLNYRAVHLLADAFEVAMTLLALAVPALRRSWRGKRVYAQYLFASLAGLGVAFGFGTMSGFWASIGLNYSSHAAYVASLATSIARWDRRWILPLVLAVAVYGLLLCGLGFHGPLDVLMAAGLAVPATRALHQLLGPEARAAASPSATEG